MGINSDSAKERTVLLSISCSSGSVVIEARVLRDSARVSRARGSARQAGQSLPAALHRAPWRPGRGHYRTEKGHVNKNQRQNNRLPNTQARGGDGNDGTAQSCRNVVTAVSSFRLPSARLLFKVTLSRGHKVSPRSELVSPPVAGHTRKLIYIAPNRK